MCGSAVQDVCGVCNVSSSQAIRQVLVIHGSILRDCVCLQGDGSSCIAVPISSESPDFDMPGCEIRARLGKHKRNPPVVVVYSSSLTDWL